MALVVDVCQSLTWVLQLQLFKQDITPTRYTSLRQLRLIYMIKWQSNEQLLLLLMVLLILLLLQQKLLCWTHRP